MAIGEFEVWNDGCSGLCTRLKHRPRDNLESSRALQVTFCESSCLWVKVTFSKRFLSIKFVSLCPHCYSELGFSSCFSCSDCFWSRVTPLGISDPSHDWKASHRRKTYWRFVHRANANFHCLDLVGWPVDATGVNLLTDCCQIRYGLLRFCFSCCSAHRFSAQDLQASQNCSCAFLLSKLASFVGTIQTIWSSYLFASSYYLTHLSLSYC